MAGEQGSAGAGVPPGQVNPGAHSVALPALTDPAAHPKPGAALQAPLQEGVDSPSAAPKYPAGQRRGVAVPGGQKRPRGQRAHVALEEAPVAALAVPAGQAVALREPKGQKDPGGHSRGAPLLQ